MDDEKKTRMAPQADTPPGTEMDAHGNPIPLEKRTREDQAKAKEAIRAGVRMEIPSAD